MKVLFQYQGLMTEEYKQFFRNELPKDIELIFAAESNPDDLVDNIREVEMYVGYSISQNMIDAGNMLKHIQIPWTGFDRLERSILNGKEKITVSNSHSNSLAIAEHAIALMFAAAKLLTVRDQKMRNGDWSTRSEAVDSYWLTGKTLGIVGYGAIGKKVARMLKLGFGMKIMAIKRHPDEPDNIADFIGSEDQLNTVLEASDYVLVSVPLTDETKDMIGIKQFEHFKKDAVLVNIARGPVINEEALYRSLKEGKIGAAGIDVWYNYPSRGQNEVRQNFPFEELENIVMTPHSAFKIRDRIEEFAQDILENIKRVFAGQEPINQVFLDLGY